MAVGREVCDERCVSGMNCNPLPSDSIEVLTGKA